ncbi:smg-9, nonsense mediated mRNA decay factor [Kappamyces sp. JEL0680]|nr:smg-9, nonsense mediated mRNA decay factor [Kappamyces sp. JEL0680]
MDKKKPHFILQSRPRTASQESENRKVASAGSGGQVAAQTSASAALTSGHLETRVGRLFAKTANANARGGSHMLCHVGDQARLIPEASIYEGLSVSPACLVVGIVGKASAGKTLIMNSLAPYSHAPFKKVKPTWGIHMYASGEGLILLDSQPILSHGNDKLLKKYGKEAIDLFSARATLFLLSVCHVVLVVNDSPKSEAQVFEYIARLDLHRQELRCPNSLTDPHGTAGAPREESAAGEDSPFQPHLIGILNKTKVEGLSRSHTARSYKVMSTILQATGLSFHGSVRDFRYPLCKTVPGKQTDGDAEQTGNYFVIPKHSIVPSAISDAVDAATLAGVWPVVARSEIALKELEAIVKAIPEYRPRSAYALSERDWYGFASAIWEAIQLIDLQESKK